MRTTTCGTSVVLTADPLQPLRLEFHQKDTQNTQWDHLESPSFLGWYPICVCLKSPAWVDERVPPIASPTGDFFTWLGPGCIAILQRSQCGESVHMDPCSGSHGGFLSHEGSPKSSKSLDPFSNFWIFLGHLYTNFCIFVVRFHSWLLTLWNPVSNKWIYHLLIDGSLTNHQLHNKHHPTTHAILLKERNLPPRNPVVLWDYLRIRYSSFHPLQKSSLNIYPQISYSRNTFSPYFDSHLIQLKWFSMDFPLFNYPSSRALNPCLRNMIKSIFSPFR